MPGPRILTLQSCRWLDRAGDDEDALLKDDEEEVSFLMDRWCKNVLRPDKHARSVRSLEIGLAGLNLTSGLHGVSLCLQIVFVSCMEREREDGE
jgi:hypothetical protein